MLIVVDWYLLIYAQIRDVCLPKYGCFFGKVPKGGGGIISDPKNYIADFVGLKAVYFGKKGQCNFQKGGERGGVIANPKNFIANLCILTNFLEKKRNVISKKGRGGGGQGRLEVFQKNIHFWADGRH